MINAARKILKFPELEATAFHVRNVAPKKEMMCISFMVPAEVAMLAGTGDKAEAEPHETAGDERPSKIQRTE